MVKPSQPTSELAKKIRFEQVKLLFAPTIFVGVGYGIVAFMTGVIQWPVINHTVIVAWLIAMGLVISWRIWLFKSFEKSKPDWHNSEYWEKRFLLGALAGGTVWGAASLFLFPPGNLAHQAFLLMIAGGMSASASMTLSALKMPAISFVVLMMVPMFYNMVLESTYMSTVSLILIIIYSILLIGSALRNYYTHLQSITLRFEAEDRESAVRTAEVKFRRVATKLGEAQRIAHIGSWELNLLNNHLVWSSEIYRIFELNEEQFDASYEAFLAKVHPKDRKAVNDAYNTSVKEHTVYDNTHRLLFDDGRIKYVHELGETYYDEQGKAINFSGTVQDITEYKLLEEQLLQSQKMEAIGTLVGGIAHDFNNILAAIQANLYMVKKQQKVNPETTIKLDNIQNLSTRAASMVRQLLTFARKDVVSMKPLQLNLFMQDEEQLTRSIIPENIERVFNICSEPILINGDATQLQQALMNLINNAVQATIDNSKPKIEFILKAWISDKKFRDRYPKLKYSRFARITVRDNGSGIAADQLEKVFDPFFTTKEVGKGTGLGLSMVYGAIQNHGGVVEVESVLEEGTTFHIYLPLQSDKTYDGSSSDTADEIVRGNGETILLVDDEKDMLNAIADVLDTLGYQVLTAFDGEDAVAKFEAQQDQIDLVITDIVMPKLGGIEAARQIREVNNNIPIIFATGYEKNKTPSDKEKPENSILLSKPFSIRELSQSLREML